MKTKRSSTDYTDFLLERFCGVLLFEEICEIGVIGG